MTKLVDRVNATINRHLPTDLLLSTTTERIEAHGVQIDLLNFHHRAGNESLPLHMLIDDLRTLGSVIAEYHGTGITRGATHLAFEVTANDGECVAVHWYT